MEMQWRCAVVTPVPKVPKPTAISDFRPISVTPLLSRVAERFLVRKWLLPAILTDMLADQFGFRPSSSTQCALSNMLHHVTTMLENCDYVRCLMIEFSRAFDVVDHPVLLLNYLNLICQNAYKTGLSLFLLAAVSLLKLIVCFHLSSTSTEV